MGLGRLEKAIASLPATGVGAKDVAALRKAAGDKLGGDEALALRQLLAAGGDRFTREGRSALEGLAGAKTHGTQQAGPARFKMEERFQLSLSEPSGLVFLGPETGFVVVNDRNPPLARVGMPHHGKVEEQTIEAHGKALTGLEGVAFDAETNQLLVLSEDRSEISTLQMVSSMKVAGTGKDLEVKAPVKLGTLPELGDAANKGWEGITLLPGSLAADRKPHLLAIHEGSPRRLALLDRKDAHMEADLKLPDSIKDAMKDLSDVAVDPSTGHVFILSDESETIFETELRCLQKAGGRGAAQWELVAVGETKLPGAKGKGRLQPEGLSFDDRGDLWVVAEGKRTLLHLERQ